MGKMIDLTGQRFGRLQVIQRAENIHNEAAWLCKCDCGQEATIRGYSLRSGATKSCGCLENENRDKGLAHLIHGGRQTRLYSIWCGMHKRCYNPNCRSYANYGGRGISICNEWLRDFTSFRDWALSHGYSDTLSIDRIDVDGNYEPSNCRWASAKEQANNRRPRRIKEDG